MPVLIILLTALAAGPAELTRMDAKELLACAGSADRCNQPDWDLARELSRRLDGKKLVAEQRSSTGSRRRILVFALYLTAPSRPVTDVMKKLARDDDQEIAYYALAYLAKGCDREALTTLAEPARWLRVPCEEWARTVAQYGKCRYAAAARFLVDSLDHGCTGVPPAARQSLHAIFRDAPASFATPAAEHAYFQARAAKQK